MSSLPDVNAAPLSFEVSGDSGVHSTLFESARSQARAEGYAAGWSTGVREARATMTQKVAEAQDQARLLAEQARDQMATAMHALESAADLLEKQAVPSAERIEKMLLSAAVDIAETLLGRELRNTDTANDALRRTLKLAPAGEPVQVRLSQRDYDALTADRREPIDVELQARFSREIVLRADPSLQPGDAITHCGATVIDGRLATAVARVREVLAS